MDFSTSPVMMRIENAVDWAIKNKTTVFAGLIALGLLGGGIAVYRYMANQARMAAHKELVQLMRMIDEPVKVTGEGADALKGSMEQQKWERVAASAQKNAQEFKGTKLGATFAAIYADALNIQNKHKEAVGVMRQAVDGMSVAAVRDYYQLKLALMLIDQNDEKEKKEGIELLKKISETPKHTAHDRGLYYLGEYFWINKQYAEAKNSWQQFVVKYGTEKGAGELVDKAKERLELLAV